MARIRTWAADSSAIQIDSSYPSALDFRRPDRTLAGTPRGAVTALVYSPDGRIAVTGSDRGEVRAWDARTGEQSTGGLARAFEGHDASIRGLTFTKDGKTLSSFSDDLLVVWEFASGTKLSSNRTSFRGEAAVVVPRESLWIADFEGPQIRIRSLQNSTPLTALGTQQGNARRLAASADGKLLAVGTDIGVQIWELGTLKKIRDVPVGSPVESLAASSTHVLAGCVDGSVKLLPIGGEESPRELKAHAGPVHAVAFSTRGDQCASGGDDKSIYVSDVATGRLLCTQAGHPAAITAIAFNSNGQKMASGDAAGNVNYWTVPLPPIAPEDLEKIKAALPAQAVAKPKKPRKLLVFWRADAILHKSGVPAANHAIELLGKKTGAFTTDFSRDYEVLDPQVLSRYDAIVLNSTAHLVIPDAGKKRALLEYVRGGGGVVGIHAAIDMFKDWPEGAEMVGATFGGHPWVPSGTWAVKLEEPAHPLLRAWGGQNFKLHDEFYELADPYRRSDRRVLMSLDLSDAATAGVTSLHRQDKDFAVSWVKRFGEGRVFYCMFGHIAEPFWNPKVLQYELDGIQYALGDLDVDDTPRPQP